MDDAKILSLSLLEYILGDIILSSYVTDNYEMK